MKRLASLLYLLTPLVMVGSLHAVTYPFPNSTSAYLNVEPAMKPGAKLYLFHSDADRATTIKVDDILTVYREYPADVPSEARETGKVKILAYLGEHYYRAQAIEGTIRPGYLARKGAVACLVTAYGGNGRYR